MLLGRAGEVGRIDGLVTRATRERVSAALIVHGEPGVGKTSLLDHVVSRHESALTVLRVHSLEAEAELAFAGLFDLVRPVEHLLGGIPPPQRAALESALALGPPTRGDRFAVAAATLSLLAAASDGSPVLAVVDDAHWLDAPSREALLFAGRRLANEGVVLLLGMRDRDWMLEAGIESLHLAGLDPRDVSALLDAAGVAIAPDVRRRLVEETRGNPLALLEAVGALSDEELRGAVPIAGPLAVGEALERSFAHHLDELPLDTRRALLIAAASPTGATGEILGALNATGLSRASLEPAERAGLVVVGERVRFRHPLIRSAVYHRHDPIERRAAHRAFASVVGTGEHVAWHLAAASAGPDEAVAVELEAVAANALSRTAFVAAAAAFETAVALSVDDSGRLRRAMGAGRALWLGGESDRAATVLEGVLHLAAEPAARADLQQLRGAALLLVAPVVETYALLVEEAERVEPYDRERAASLFASASFICLSRGDFEHTAECARRALAAADGGTAAAEIVAPLLAGVGAAIRGEVSEARALLEPLLERVVLVDPLGELFQVLVTLPQALVWIERWTLAEPSFDRIVSAARTAGAPSALPFPLAAMAEFEFRRGRLAPAYAAATESVQLAADTGQTVASAFSLAVLARVEAVLGHEHDCRAHASAALDLSDRTGARSIEAYVEAALGLLELSHGHADRAAVHLAKAAHVGAALGITLPTVGMWSADLIEACARAGAHAQASSELTALQTHSEVSGLRWALAGAARGRGLLAEDGFEPEFEAALELYGADMPFERARAQLCLGMRRRRAHHRAAARTALGYFDAAGAEPWVEQARAELRATGETPTRNVAGSLRELTPQELQVALIVATGATNRETAASLFLSDKTVEFHLSNAYRKLGIRSRAELVRRVEGLP